MIERADFSLTPERNDKCVKPLHLPRVPTRLIGPAYEIQVKYTTGWEKLLDVDPHIVPQTWHHAKKRWKNLTLRMVRDGKPITMR